MDARGAASLSKNPATIHGPGRNGRRRWPGASSAYGGGHGVDRGGLLMRRPRRAALAILALTAAAPAAAAMASGPASASSALRPAVVRGGYRAFSDPTPVTILGYRASAMEPFVSLDGRYLLFNTSNVAPAIPALQFAVRSGSRTFTYGGPIRGANQPGFLSGTPSMDRDGILYFVSTRDYADRRATVYAGRFESGAVRKVHPVPGVAAPAPGQVDFDVSVSPDGGWLYVSVGQFGSGSGPSRAGLALYRRRGRGFVADPRSAALLSAVNRAGPLVYAASVSADDRELFFTVADPTGQAVQIDRAVRSSTTRPFGHVQRVAAVSGFAEAPSLSGDGTTLYYHLRVGQQFAIQQVTRPAPGGTAVPVSH